MVNEEKIDDINFAVQTTGGRETKLGILRMDYPDEIDDNSKYPIAKIMMFGLGTNDSGISFETKIGGNLAERLGIDSKGNVGIGVANPPARLSIKGKEIQIQGVSIIAGTNMATGHDFINNIEKGDIITISGETKTVIDILNNNSISVDSNFTNTTPTGGSLLTVNPCLFRADDHNGNMKLIISDNGNVGIGTLCPKTSLHIALEHRPDEIGLQIGDNRNIDIASKIAINNFFFKNGFDSIRYLKLFQGDYGPDSKELLAVRVNGSTKISGKLGTTHYDPDSGYPAGWGGGIHSGDVYAEGSVGAGQSGNLNAYFDQTGNAYFGGKVGIGKTDPSGNLHIGGPGPDIFLAGNTTIGQDGLRIHYNEAAGLRSGVIDVKGSSLALRGDSTGNGNTDMLFIDLAKGNVGIGTNPDHKLDINGNIHVRGNRTMLTGLDGPFHWITVGGTEVNGNGILGLYYDPGDPHPAQVYVSGRLYAPILESPQKNFMIDHPLYPQDKHLIHSVLEGPEIAVFYRGEAQLSNGEAMISLPDYFEALTRKENRTVLITSKFEDDLPISVLAASEVKDGKFTVRMIDNKSPSQKFYWEVKAVRSDVSILEVERVKKTN